MAKRWVIEARISKIKKLVCRLDDAFSQSIGSFTTTLSNDLQDVWQILWFVTIDFWSIVARREVGGICFDHQSVDRNCFDDFTQMFAASFIANPTGNPEMEIEVEVSFGLLHRAGKAMHDGATDFVSSLVHHLQEFIKGVTFM